MLPNLVFSLLVDLTRSQTSTFASQAVPGFLLCAIYAGSARPREASESPHGTNDLTFPPIATVTSTVSAGVEGIRLPLRAALNFVLDNRENSRKFAPPFKLPIQRTALTLYL